MKTITGLDMAVDSLDALETEINLHLNDDAFKTREANEMGQKVKELHMLAIQIMEVFSLIVSSPP